ncbi:MAG TPA: hypothetical protein VLT58_05485 [Polyangia bacterium]|nr:hypothetical protein [Polyangia bacterium]
MTLSPSRYLLAVLVAVAEGCATIQSGPVGVPLDAANHPLPEAAPAPLRVSAAEIEGASSPYFGLIEVTFENDSPAWQQIDRIDLDFGNADRNRSVQIPWGDDLDTWYEAVSTRNAIRAENAQMVLHTLAIVGALGRATQARHGHGAAASAAEVGGVLSVAALGALYVNEQKQDAEAASGGPRFGAGHLLSTPIRVPPGLFTKRWILLYTAARPLGGCIDRMVLGYHLSDRREARVLLQYKAAGSEWQRASCGEAPGPFNNH